MSRLLNSRQTTTDNALVRPRPSDLNQLVSAKPGALQSSFAAVAAVGGHTLNSRPRQHCGHWATVPEVARMTGIEGTYDIDLSAHS
jgi:hypothetical protein